ncbi:MAG: flavin reductase family protein [Pseudolabrys sp.]|nr:flavin reductase family protein [Pseudolabrys sp.]
MTHLKVLPPVTSETPPVDSEAFRASMRQLAVGVSVITAGQGTDRTGMTVTSLSSFSIAPPSLIVSINRAASIRPLLDRYRTFGASILGTGHNAVADRFAGVGGLKGNGRFIGEKWITLETGAPLLAGALAVFDCEIEEIIERHTHSIVIGLVKAARATEGSPLVHWQGQCRAFAG